MANAFGINESIVFAPNSPQKGYAYRTGIGMFPSAEWNVEFYDFNRVVSTNVPSGWSAAIIDTGATLTLSTTAGSLGATGGALIASDGTSEGVSIYLPKAIQLTSGKRFMMEVRVQTSVAAETDVQFGLSSLTATTNPEDLWTTTAADLVAFGTLAGAATTKMLADKSNSGTTAETGTLSLSNTTWAILGIFYDGGTGLYGYVDGNLSLKYSQTAGIPTGVALAPFIGARTGATAGNVTTFDYVRIHLER